MTILNFGDITVAVSRFGDDEPMLREWQTAELEVISTDKRRRERRATYGLLNQLIDSDYRLIHDADGRPVLTDADGRLLDLHLSITHSSTCVAVALARHAAGIDVETLSPKIERVARKFLSDSEMDLLSTPVARLMAWTIKEAVYKTVSISGLPLAGGIVVDRVEFNDDLSRANSNVTVNHGGRRLSLRCESILSADEVLTVAFIP